MLTGAWNIVKYLSVGGLLWLLGSLFLGDSLAFRRQSVPEQLFVVDVESKRLPEGGWTYRPVLARQADSPPRSEYAGDSWSRFRLHTPGETVAGRYDPASGEMRSDRMDALGFWSGCVARILGILIALQALLILAGFPEGRLPLRIRLGWGRPRRLPFDI